MNARIACVISAHCSAGPVGHDVVRPSSCPVRSAVNRDNLSSSRKHSRPATLLVLRRTSNVPYSYSLLVDNRAYVVRLAATKRRALVEPTVFAHLYFLPAVHRRSRIAVHEFSHLFLAYLLASVEFAEHTCVRCTLATALCARHATRHRQTDRQTETHRYSGTDWENDIEETKPGAGVRGRCG